MSDDRPGDFHARLTRRRTVREPYGIKCDCCGKVDDHGLNDFVLRHTLGYDSTHDMTNIEAAICDICLLDLVLAHVPDARFKDASGRPLSRKRLVTDHGAAMRRRGVAAAEPG